MTDRSPTGAGPELSYEASGVNYDQLDAFKRACQRAAAGTTGAAARHGLSEPAGIRGESAYLLETPDEFLAHVEEGLGTKNLIADAMLQLTGQSYYRNIGIDLVATIVNDLITTGAAPLSVAMHAAVGDADWFTDPRRGAALADGFAEGCRQSDAVWGGGETPTLRGIVNPAAIVLGGSALGRIRPKSRRITGAVRPGDAIILLASTGVQTNGLTLCRQIADRLPQGYLTPIGDGRPFGQALLDASAIYVRYVAALQSAGVEIRYAVHLTGHGWRKLMRLNEPFVYRLTRLQGERPIPAVFDFIRSAGPVSLREAYATFNMGAGFAVYVAPESADDCVRLAREIGCDAWVGGSIASENGRKAVELAPAGLVYEADSLQVR